MKLIIDIPENEYKILKSISGFMPWAECVIRNGTPLPKGYGRLMILSEDKLKESQIDLDSSCQKWISEVGISNATVAIIEEDGSEKE